MSEIIVVDGCMGQDSSYLIKHLLDQGREVIGVTRRSGSSTSWRHDELKITGKFKIEYCDINEIHSVNRLIRKYKPKEYYHLAAQSFVKDSFDNPYCTVMTNAIGTMNILESIRHISPATRMYNASTSEMFGRVLEVPQSESTPFNPVSPYGASKLFAHEMVKIYRESYNMFCCSGILFNHESVAKNSPILVKDKYGFIDIVPIEDMFRSESHRYDGLLNLYKDCFVWNGTEWTKLIKGTAYSDKEKKMRMIQTVGSCYEATEDHVAFDYDDNEVYTKDWKIGDTVFKCSYPEFNESNFELSDSFAKFVGFVVRDGYISPEGRIQLVGKNLEELRNIAGLLCNSYNYTWKESFSDGEGFNYNNEPIYKVDIDNETSLGIWLRENIYTNHSKEKRIPKFILNAPVKIKKSFFDGYYIAYGRKKGNEVYAYKGFTSSSASLCLGLNYIFKSFSNQEIKTKCELVEGRRYYYTQFNTTDPSSRGAHFRKPKNEVVKIQETTTEDGWFFDLQTESKTFCTGPNLFKIHNSPLRGIEFVTKKITHGLVNWIKTKEPIVLGNLDAKRDWGHASDYTKMMMLMLQQDTPKDYVIATGSMYTIRDFIFKCLNALDISFNTRGSGIDEVITDTSGNIIVSVSKEFFRENEVNELLGDSSKAQKELGWRRDYDLDALIKDMIDYELGC